MKRSDVKIGAMYRAKVSGRVVTIKILKEHHTKGWMAKNLETGREIHIVGSQRLRNEVFTPTGL